MKRDSKFAYKVLHEYISTRQSTCRKHAQHLSLVTSSCGAILCISVLAFCDVQQTIAGTLHRSANPILRELFRLAEAVLTPRASDAVPRRGPFVTPACFFGFPTVGNFARVPKAWFMAAAPARAAPEHLLDHPYFGVAAPRRLPFASALAPRPVRATARAARFAPHAAMALMMSEVAPATADELRDDDSAVALADLHRAGQRKRRRERGPS